MGGEFILLSSALYPFWQDYLSCEQHNLVGNTDLHLFGVFVTCICFDFYDWYDDDGSPFDLLLQEEYVCNKRQVLLDAYRGFGRKGVIQKK